VTLLDRSLVTGRRKPPTEDAKCGGTCCGPMSGNVLWRTPSMMPCRCRHRAFDPASLRPAYDTFGEMMSFTAATLTKPQEISGHRGRQIRQTPFRNIWAHMLKQINGFIAPIPMRHVVENRVRRQFGLGWTACARPRDPAISSRSGDHPHVQCPVTH